MRGVVLCGCLAARVGNGCAATARGMRGRGVVGLGWRAGRRERAGLPELEELFEAGEQAQQAGGDQGVDRLAEKAACRRCLGSNFEVGDLVRQRGGLRVHSPFYN